MGKPLAWPERPDRATPDPILPLSTGGTRFRGLTDPAPNRRPPFHGVVVLLDQPTRDNVHGGMLCSRAKIRKVSDPPPPGPGGSRPHHHSNEPCCRYGHQPRYRHTSANVS